MPSYEVNVPSYEVKTQLAFYNVRWFKYSFCNSDIWCFKTFCGSANNFYTFFLKWRRKSRRFWVQYFLWSSKILFCFYSKLKCFFFSNGHFRNVVSTLLNVVKIYVENDNVVSTLPNVIQINFEIDNVDSTFTAQKMKFSIKDFFNVIKSGGNCKFGHIYWRNP